MYTIWLRLSLLVLPVTKAKQWFGFFFIGLMFFFVILMPPGYFVPPIGLEQLRTHQELSSAYAVKEKEMLKEHELKAKEKEGLVDKKESLEEAKKRFQYEYFKVLANIYQFNGMRRIEEDIRTWGEKAKILALKDKSFASISSLASSGEIIKNWNQPEKMKVMPISEQTHYLKEMTGEAQTWTYTLCALLGVAAIGWGWIEVNENNKQPNTLIQVHLAPVMLLPLILLPFWVGGVGWQGYCAVWGVCWLIFDMQKYGFKTRWEWGKAIFPKALRFVFESGTATHYLNLEKQLAERLGWEKTGEGPRERDTDSQKNGKKEAEWVLKDSVAPVWLKAIHKKSSLIIHPISLYLLWSGAILGVLWFSELNVKDISLWDTAFPLLVNMQLLNMWEVVGIVLFKMSALAFFGVGVVLTGALLTLSGVYVVLTLIFLLPMWIVKLSFGVKKGRAALRVVMNNRTDSLVKGGVFKTVFVKFKKICTSVNELIKNQKTKTQNILQKISSEGVIDAQTLATLQTNLAQKEKKVLTEFIEANGAKSNTSKADSIRRL